MSQLSSKRILRLTAGGALGGLISFLTLNPGAVRREMADAATGEAGQAVLDAFGNAVMLGAVIGMAVGACLIAMEEVESGRPARLALRTTLGAVIGAAGGVAGQLMFSLLLLVNVVLARTLGWCLLGVAAGVCPGIASGSSARTRQGTLGGAAGGAVGGILFDLIGLFSANGSVSRAFGMIVLGAMVGIAVALVEELAKECWVTLLTGAREGRTYILSKAQTTLGRDEVADVPLFGDFSVQKLHARLVRSPAGVELHAAPGCAVRVDSQPGSAFTLTDGAVISLGNHRLRFHAKGGARAQTGGAVPSSYQPAPTAAPLAPAPPGPAPVSRLEIVAGPHQGESVWLQGGLYTLGRDPAASIPLVHDGMASRQHAQIVHDEHGWRVDDLGSTNGLFVNGERVTVHWLRPGDEIGIGRTVLRAA